MILKKSFLVIVLCSLYLFSFAEGKIILEIKKIGDKPDIRFMSTATFDVFITNNSDQEIKIVDPYKSDRYYNTHRAEDFVYVNGKVEKSWWMVEGPERKYSKKEVVTLKPNESRVVHFIRIPIRDTAEYKVIVNYQQMINPYEDVVKALGKETIESMAMKLTAEIHFKPVLPIATSDNLDLSYEDIVKPPQNTFSLSEALSQDNWDHIYRVTIDAGEMQLAQFLPLLKNIRWVHFKIRNQDSIPASLACLSKLKAVTIGGYFPQANEARKPVYIEPLKDIVGLEYLKLTNTFHKEMPTWMGNFSKLEHLFLSNAFNEFGPELGKLSSLKNLTIYASQKQSLPKELALLKNLTNLEIKDLYTPAPEGIFLSSKLEKLDLGLFTDQLDLAGCQAKEIKIIQNIESNVPLAGMKDLAQLNTLFIETSSASFPDLSNCNKLEHIEIRNRKITNIPECIYLLPNLKILELICSNLSSLDEKIGNMASLELLRLDGAKITSFPQEFANLKALKKLFHYRNPIIDEVPEVFFSLTNLEYLNLSETNINRIPAKISNLKNLKSLGFSSNKLRSLPKEIGDLVNLEELNVTDNQIMSLPEEIGKLRDMKSLSISNNMLVTFPMSFYNLPALEKIYVRKNPLSDVTRANLKNLNLIKPKLVIWTE